MSCDHELANEWPRCSRKNASYITTIIVFLCFLLNFSFDWENLSNIQFLSTFPSTAQSSAAILRCASYFQLSSRCLEMCSNTVFRVLYYILRKIRETEFHLISQTRRGFCFGEIRGVWNCDKALSRSLNCLVKSTRNEFYCWVNQQGFLCS